MSAALIDLVSIGAQDVYITGNPEVSFFRQNYKRHTNFAIKPERLDYIGTFASGNEVSIPIKSKGDLLSYVWIENANINNNNHNDSIFKSANATSNETSPTEFALYIGGQEVTKLDTLFINTVQNTLYNESSAKASCATTTQDEGPNASNDSYIIPFFFSEDWTKSLPLVGLQYHEVEIRIHWGSGVNNDIGSLNFECYSNYYYLDNEERGNLVSRNHDLLITQVQKSIPSNELVQELTFNHPIKYLASSDTTTDGALTSPINKIKIEINGLDIGNFKWAKPHFIDVMNYYHTNFVTSPDFFLYCFCLSTSSLQPTGTLNFSRLDSAKILSQSMVIRDPIYAVNYNILRIENGMAGLIYAN